MSRLTARTENGNAYLVNVKPDEQEVDSPHKNTLQCILDCFERLAQYEDAEEQGLLVVLPCKVGDTVYKLWYEPCHNGEDRPDGMGCAGCIDECDIKRAVVPFTANSVEHIVGMRNSLNRFWFLTLAEAENAMAND